MSVSSLGNNFWARAAKFQPNDALPWQAEFGQNAFLLGERDPALLA